MLLSLIQLKIAAAPLEHSQLFGSLLGGLAGDPFLGFFVAVALTWLMHSSLTMVLFVMALATANAIPLPLAFALVLGANVGGAIAPFSGADRITTGRAPRRGRNLAMRLAVAIPFLFLLNPSLALPADRDHQPRPSGAQLPHGVQLRASLVFLPLAGLVARLVLRIRAADPDAYRAADDARPRQRRRADTHLSPR